MKLIKQSFVLPATTETIPVGTPANWGLSVTVNLSVCSWPWITDLAESVSPVLVAAFDTVKNVAADVEEPK